MISSPEKINLSQNKGKLFKTKAQTQIISILTLHFSHATPWAYLLYMFNTYSTTGGKMNFLKKIFNRKSKKIQIGSSKPTFNEKHKALFPPVDDTIETFHDHYEVHDHFRPLEDIHNIATVEWIDRQNEKFSDYISGMTKSQEQTSAFFKKVRDYESETIPSQYGDYHFSSYNDGKSNHSIYQVRKGSVEAQARTLIDPNALNKEGTTAVQGIYPSPDGKHVAYILSENGSDSSTLYLLDTETGINISDKIENCRFSNVIWDKDAKGFHYTYPMHDENKRREIKHHKLGEDVANDRQIFAPQDLEQAWSHYSTSRDKEYEWISYGVGTSRTHGLSYRMRGETCDFKKVIDDGLGKLSPIGEVNGRMYAVTDIDAPNSRLVSIDLNNPTPENWETLMEGKADKILSSAFIQQGKLFVTHDVDTAEQLSVYDLACTHLYDVKFPLEHCLWSPSKFTPEDTKIKMSFTSNQQAGDVYEYDILKNSFELIKQSAMKENLKDCIVERIYATSKDGTKVPMTVIRRSDIELDGSAAVKLYGYGGFNVPLTPGFKPSVAHWVRAGGIYVEANLRGGGEFGREWYDQGRLHNKQNVFDDFIGCAEHLIKGKYTSKKRLAIAGGSNGGLLTAACYLQRPDLFGAVISAVPVIDMFRFQHGTYGAAWKSDYGNPDIKKDFNTAAKYSPLHNVKSGAKYPPILINTGDHDDRVLPWHSYKFAATLQAKANDNNTVLLRVGKNVGHGAGKSQEKQIKEFSEVFAFLEKTLGSIDQKTYKKSLSITQRLKNKIKR